MSDTVIRVNGLGKLYRIGTAREKTDGLRHALENGIRRLGRRLRRRPDPNPAQEDFWALRDVSFEIKRGECVGVIGRNGAGKSTLLKILSRITEPTTGEVGLKGRVGSLLEVGTGFHPELTGRENIFLNGAVLGMSRKEIAKKFDEIVAFSEVEKFLDTPVKRYSSGMYVRLAFAVAAHLEPEILIVDEVLAVGDSGFQNKCLGKMGDVAGAGRTVLLVSHQMQAVQSICQKGLLLERGQISAFGPTHEVVRRYLGQSRATQDLGSMTQTGSGEAKFVQLRIQAHNSDVGETLVRGVPLQLTATFEVIADINDCDISLAVRNGEGIELFSHSWCDQYDKYKNVSAGEHTLRILVPTDHLRPGPYWLTLCLTQRTGHVVALATGIELPSIIISENRKINLEANRWGCVFIPCLWSDL